MEKYGTGGFHEGSAWHLQIMCWARETDIDPSRVGVIGWFLLMVLVTNWTIGHTDRFVSAASSKVPLQLDLPLSTRQISGIPLPDGEQLSSTVESAEKRGKHSVKICRNQ